MPEHAAVRTGWVLPTLLAITTTFAVTLGFLYLIRPNAGELGAIRVVFSDDTPDKTNAIHILVAEAPFVQGDTVTPGPAYYGGVHYPAPYLTKPNLKLKSQGKRHYDVIVETERGFSWAARLAPDDVREGAKKESGVVEKLLGDQTSFAALKGDLKPGLVFDDFTWEAKGIRAPLASIPATFEQSGTFYANRDAKGEEFFPIPYESPPNVQVKPDYIFIVETTNKSFKWQHNGWPASGAITWTAKGVLTKSMPVK